MASSTAFFNPTSPFGTLTGWEVNTENPNSSAQRAQALGSDGDEIDKQEYDHKTTTSCQYVCKANNAVIPKYGAVLNGWHVDSVVVNFSNTAFVTMTLTGHKHNGASHAACRTYTGSLDKVASKFGCPATIVGITIPTGAGVRSITYTLQGNHVDELGSAGEFLAADNYDGNETVDVELCDTATLAAATGWSLTSHGNAYGNTAAQTSSGTAEHHLAHDTTST